MALGGVQNNRGGGAVEFALDQSALNDLRPRVCAFMYERFAALA